MNRMRAFLIIMIITIFTSSVFPSIGPIFGRVVGTKDFAGASSSYDIQAAVNYAETWWNGRNPAYYDYSDYGGDCANFVSQCLIAGGLNLGVCPYVDSWGCIPSCDNLHKYLVNYLGAQYEVRRRGEVEPLWFLKGDPAIFGDDSDNWRHAAFAVIGDDYNYARCNAHSQDTYHITIPSFFQANPSFALCNYYHIPSNPPQPVPIITSSLRLVQAAPYYVGDSITAQFTIANRGTASITFDVLTVGGRDPDNNVADFTWLRNIALSPYQSYDYQGTLTLSKSGNYHFFCAYRTPDGNWNTAIPTDDGFTNVLDITVLAHAQAFALGDRVQSTANVNVREGPGLGYLIITTEPVGATGVVVCSKPQQSDGYTWWVIKYSDGTRGWSVDDGLERTGAISIITNLPMTYIHQCYDTRNDFDGRWACGATSAVMALAYYAKIDSWPYTCSYPYTHISNFGNYISQTYVSCTGYTFDTITNDAGGYPARGRMAIFIIRMA